MGETIYPKPSPTILIQEDRLGEGKYLLQCTVLDEHQKPVPNAIVRIVGAEIPNGIIDTPTDQHGMVTQTITVPVRRMWISISVLGTAILTRHMTLYNKNTPSSK